MNEQKTALIGRDAAAVLESDAFKFALTTLKESVIQRWRDCPIRDREGQMLLLQTAKLADQFESVLIGLVESGKYAQTKIDIDKMRNESAPRQFFRKVVG